MVVIAVFSGLGPWACQCESSSPPTSERVAEPEATAAKPQEAAAEPEGFGNAKFKMTPEQAKAALPGLEETEEDLGAALVGGPYVKRFVLRNHPVPGLQHPTNVEIRFWKDRLWVVIVYFGQNDYPSVVEALEKQLGSTSKGDEKSRVWIGEKTTSVASDREKYYSLADNDLSNEARAALFLGIHHGGAAATPGAS
jgi:hypothetical protein